MLLQLYYRNRIVWDLYYPGDFALHQKLLGIVTRYVTRLTAEYPYLSRQVTTVDYYFENPLKRFSQTNSYGHLTDRGDQEVRATVITMRGAVALAIAQWEKRQREQFEETDHPNYGYYEAMEHLHGFGDDDVKGRPE
jgi:hypothetical protein